MHYYRLPNTELSRRQKEIASLRLDGLTVDQIATRLHISSRTVENHLQNIYQKVGCHNVGGLMKALASQATTSGTEDNRLTVPVEKKALKVFTR
jgi:DNA-binding NarL/FixJ family response regulator